MATNNRGGNRGGTRSRGGRNNNPEGRNQYSGMKPENFTMLQLVQNQLLRHWADNP